MIFSKYCVLSALATSVIYANIGPEGFKNYPNDYFVETGTFHGDGIARALKDGFKYVISLEINPEYAEVAKSLFRDYEHVQIHCGDSSSDLWPLIQSIDKSITFWLDGHNIYPILGAKNCPLLEELEQIKRHPIKTHTIIVDDMHCLDTIYFDYLTREILIAKIKEINTNYKISYVTGGDTGSHPNNILVATP